MLVYELILHVGIINEKDEKKKQEVPICYGQFYATIFKV